MTRVGTTALARATRAYLRHVTKSATLVGADVAAERAAAVRSAFAGRRTVHFYWNEDALLLASFAARDDSPLTSAVAPIEVVYDESYGGHATRALVTRLGLGARRLRWAGQGQRAQDMLSLMRTASRIAIAVDGHGPYGIVGTAFVRFVRRWKAVAIPVAAAAASSRSLPIRAPMQLPKPGATLAVVLGRVVDATELEGDALRNALTDALLAANRAAAELVESRRHDRLPADDRV